MQNKIVNKLCSNGIALLALAFSGIALWQSHEANRPNVQLQELPFLVWEIHNGEDRTYYGLLRLLISNNGGGTVTLNTISKREDADLALGVYNDGELRNLSRSINFYTFDDSVKNQYEIFTNFDMIKKYIQLTSNEFYWGKNIDAGHAIPLNIGLSTRYMDEEIESLIINLEAHFSDGKIVPITATIDSKVRRRGR